MPNTSFSPRITLAFGDALPPHTDVLVREDETSGQLAAVDLTGLTLSLKFQARGASSVPVTIPIVNAQMSPSTYRGRYTIVWSALTGVPAAGDYDYRIVTVDGTGKTESFPKDGFWLLRVGADFRAGGGSLAPPSGPWITVDTIAILRILDVSTSLAGLAFILVRESNKRFRFDVTTGLPDDGIAIISSSNGAYQWLQF